MTVIAAAKERGLRSSSRSIPAKARAVADNGPAGFDRLLRARRDCVLRTPPLSSSATSRTSRASGSRSSMRTALRPRPQPYCRAGGLLRRDPCRDRKQVIGVGLSPRGNDNPTAPSNISTSPVRFIRALGAAYRASGRRQPIMDALQLPPYPNANTDPPVVGYQWPNAGIAEPRPDQAGALGRVQRHGAAALRDRPAALAGRGRLAGSDRGSAAYTGARTSRTVDEAGRPRSTPRSSGSAACDPQVARSTSSTGSTSRTAAASRAVPSVPTARERPAFDAVAQAVADTNGGTVCLGSPVVWKHTTSVVGATAKFSRLDGAHDRGGCPRECDRHLRPRRRRREADADGVRQEGGRRRARVARHAFVASALRRHRGALDGCQGAHEEGARPAAARLRKSRYVLADLAERRVQSRAHVALRRPELCGRWAAGGDDCARGTVLAEFSAHLRCDQGSARSEVEAWFEYGPRTTLTRSTKPGAPRPECPDHLGAARGSQAVRALVVPSRRA